MDPFLKAVGGKRWLAAELTREIIAIDPVLYVEPFVGGGAVALTLPPRLPKLVADANPAFIAVWQVIKTRKPEEILDDLARVYREFPDTAFGYARAVAALNGYLGDRVVDGHGHQLRFAALAIYVNVRCFNGLWRVNGDGLFNTPWAKYQSPRRLTLGELRVYQEVLSQTTPVCRGFRETLSELLQHPRAERSKIVIFADPPYDSIADDKGRKTFVKYTAEGFDDTDQRDLAQWLKHLGGLGMRVFATNADTPLVREIYAWAKIQAITENHTVGATAKRRGERQCLLIRSH